MNMGGFSKKTIFDVPLDGKTVLVRADYNVPLNAKGEIQDDFRIRASLPTIRELIKRGCKVVIISHLGRPEGKIVPGLSLEPVATRLGMLLKHPVIFVSACIGDMARMTIKNVPAGSVLLLENLRFHPEEETNNSAFAEALVNASGAAYFVQDGFGVVHRAHASTSAITQYLPSISGILLEREYQTLTAVMTTPEHPMVAVLGGAKIADKITIIERLIAIADKVIIGGAMANTFLRYRKYPIGKSVYEEGLDDTVKKIYAAAAKKVGEEAVDDFLILPVDVAVATAITSDARRVVVERQDVTTDEIILDSGPATMKLIDTIVEEAKTVVWNGTLGYAELQQFAHGSARLALAIASNSHTTSIIGGGDTADFVLHWDAQAGASFSHVSTGGGASLELLSGKPMPGVAALMDA